MTGGFDPRIPGSFATRRHTPDAPLRAYTIFVALSTADNAIDHPTPWTVVSPSLIASPPREAD